MLNCCGMFCSIWVWFRRYLGLKDRPKNWTDEKSALDGHRWADETLPNGYRFSLSIFWTPPQLRSSRSTSWRYGVFHTLATPHDRESWARELLKECLLTYFVSFRLSSQLHAPSSWTSSAQDALPSPPSFPMPRPSSSAAPARPFCASQPVVRPDSQRDAPSAGSKCL
jgi:hypothetical protein